MEVDNFLALFWLISYLVDLKVFSSKSFLKKSSKKITQKQGGRTQTCGTAQKTAATNTITTTWCRLTKF